MLQNKFVVGTRFYESNPAKAMESNHKLLAFIASARAAGASKVLVAVNVDENKSGLLRDWTYGTAADAEIFPVTPWGKFVQPLNALLIKGREEFAKGAHFLSASVEVKLTPEIVDALFKHMDANTLVVGAAMEGHDYRPYQLIKEANGRQVPWNTLALWNSRLLCKTGFQLIGDGPLNQPENAGVEELATVALHPDAKFGQVLSPVRLVRVPGISWDTSGFDAVRLAAHEKKMASKVTRAEAQLRYAGLLAPTVLHI